MTTAVAPRKAKNWGEVFPESKGFADEGSHWRTINSILYNIALGARFGFTGLPHDFDLDNYSDENDTLPVGKRKCSKCKEIEKYHPTTLSLFEQSLLAMVHAWQENSMMIDAEYGSEEWKKIASDLGEVMMLSIRIANADPTVGHFVGQGFDENEKAADKFLNHDPKITVKEK